jgi:hypothetical protein
MSVVAESADDLDNQVGVDVGVGERPEDLRARTVSYFSCCQDNRILPNCKCGKLKPLVSESKNFWMEEGNANQVSRIGDCS